LLIILDSQKIRWILSLYWTARTQLTTTPEVGNIVYSQKTGIKNCVRLSYETHKLGLHSISKSKKDFCTNYTTLRFETLPSYYHVSHAESECTNDKNNNNNYGYNLQSMASSSIIFICTLGGKQTTLCVCLMCGAT